MKITKTILLIEDDIDDQEFFADALKGIPNAGLLHVANNGREALEILRSQSPLPDIIFSDINMPVMNGIECLREIQRHRHTKNIPVVMLSSDTARREIVFGLGANSFIEKTSVLTILQMQIRQLINQGPKNIFETHSFKTIRSILAECRNFHYSQNTTIPALN